MIHQFVNVHHLDLCHLEFLSIRQKWKVAISFRLEDPDRRGPIERSDGALRRFALPGENVQQVVFSPDSRRLLATLADRSSGE